jgi:16S rRNA (adenine1518-N6/adenine1519-N6)-dimethyltransferase
MKKNTSENVRQDGSCEKPQVRPLSTDEIQSLLRKYGIRPSKKFGQSFLKSHSIAREIVSAANITSKDTVLEVGGGLGILSEEIAQHAGQLYVVEIASGLVQALRNLLHDRENVTVIEGDALTVDFPEVNKVVSNLPYSISSEITFRLLRELTFDQAVLMYQKEFAQRLLAEPASQDYSRLTINIRYQANIERLMEVPASMFFPTPAVDSVVVRVTHSIGGPKARNDHVFFWMVTGLYSYPNKNLRKALRIWFRNLSLDTSLADTIIERCQDNLNGTERLRTISLENLVTLADSILDSIEEGAVPDPRREGHERAI